MTPPIHIDLVPHPDPFTGTVVVDVVARTDGDPQRIVAADIGFQWNPRDLELLYATDERATVDNTLAGIFTVPWDFYGVNEAQPPADGDAWVMWLSPLDGIPVVIDRAVLVSLVFELHATKATVAVARDLEADIPFRTVVYGTDIPAFVVTGELGSCTIRTARRRNDAR